MLTANGWPVIETNRTTGPLPRLRKVTIPGTGGVYLYLRDGACALVLAHVALWFHEKVERLDVTAIQDDWGWAVRPVRGQTTGYSNHAGAVAEDLNATRHPRGVPASRTFTPTQVRAIQLRMRTTYAARVIWGGMWRTPDGMHFELAPGTLRQVELLARVLMLTPRGRRILAANPGLREAILS